MGVSGHDAKRKVLELEARVTQLTLDQRKALRVIRSLRRDLRYYTAPAMDPVELPSLVKARSFLKRVKLSKEGAQRAT